MKLIQYLIYLSIPISSTKSGTSARVRLTLDSLQAGLQTILVFVPQQVQLKKLDKKENKNIKLLKKLYLEGWHL